MWRCAARATAPGRALRYCIFDVWRHAFCFLVAEGCLFRLPVRTSQETIQSLRPSPECINSIRNSHLKISVFVNSLRNFIGVECCGWAKVSVCRRIMAQLSQRPRCVRGVSATVHFRQRQHYYGLRVLNLCHTFVAMCLTLFFLCEEILKEISKKNLKQCQGRSILHWVVKKL